MRIAYLECFSGMSGDMFLGALVDAGVPPRLLEETVAALGCRGAAGDFARGAQRDFGDQGRRLGRWREGFAAGRVSGQQKQNVARAHARALSPRARSSSITSMRTSMITSTSIATRIPRARAPHEHAHTHGRGLDRDSRDHSARQRSATRPRRRRSRSLRRWARPRPRFTTRPSRAVHFHEVGAVDAMVDIVCAAVGAEALGVDEIVCSPLNVGGGTVKCAHGTFPVPAPATVELLKDAPVYSSGRAGGIGHADWGGDREDAGHALCRVSRDED